MKWSSVVVVLLVVLGCEDGKPDTRRVVSPYAARTAADSAYRAGYAMGWTNGWTVGYLTKVCVR